MAKILFFVTEDWYFWSHRLPLAKAMKKKGFEVVVAVRENNHGARIRKEGFKLVPLRLQRSGRNPVLELVSIIELIQLYRSEKPDIVHQVALKPVLYGSFAAFIVGKIKLVNALAGLGHVFVAKGIKASLVRVAMKWALGLALRMKNSKVILQNPDDKDVLTSSGVLKDGQVVLIRGAGVDIDIFTPPENDETLEPVVLFAARMLWTKGVGEFVQMARELRKNGVKARMIMAGFPDKDNPACVPESVLKNWDREGVIEYWGSREDMPEVMKSASIVVLPSRYGEGIPKTLIEASATGRPVVAFDAPGCRDIVIHGKNGYLAPMGDVAKLIEHVEDLLKDRELRQKMGRAGRKIAIEKFSEKQVVKETCDLYDSLLINSPAP